MKLKGKVRLRKKTTSWVIRDWNMLGIELRKEIFGSEKLEEVGFWIDLMQMKASEHCDLSLT